MRGVRRGRNSLRLDGEGEGEKERKDEDDVEEAGGIVNMLYVVWAFSVFACLSSRS